MSWPAPTGNPVGPDGGSANQPPHPDAAQPPVGYPPPQGQDPTAQQSVQQPPPVGRPVEVASQPDAARTSELQPPLHGGIATLAPAASAPKRLARMNERTGRPVRPWTIWVSATLFFAAGGAVAAGLLLAMWQMASPWVEVGDNQWTKDDKFNEATWLTTQFPSEPASWQRVMFAIVCCAITVLVAAAVTTVGYYAFAGYRWTRIGGAVATGVCLLSLLLTPLAALSIALAALATAPLWLPASTRFFARWDLWRNPRVAYSEPVENVVYGPLPRYR